MGYAQPTPNTPPARMMPPSQAQTSPPPVRLPRGRKALVTVIFVGLMGLGYLCALVRVSELDLGCQQLRSDCRSIEAEIRELAIAHGARIDGAKIDRIIEEKKLVRPMARETASVSPELCPEQERSAGGASRGTATVASTWADVNDSSQW